MFIDQIDNIEEYLRQHEQKQMLRFITCGSVDDGKSTLIGRLLHDSKMIFEDHLAAITRDSVKHGTTGTAVDLALLVDGLQSEREQGITIDVAYRFFATEQRKYIIADTPGHAQYTRNMATGASTADVAILLIDARYGVQTQTRRHSYICALLGIQHFVVAINKMDLIDFSEQKFLAIQQDYEQFLNQLRAQMNISPQHTQQVHYVPMSALNGDNVVNASPHMPWYTGTPLLDLLDHLPISRTQKTSDLRFPVQYVNRPNLNFRGFCGTLAAGTIQPGTTIKVLPSGKTSRVKAIVTWEGEQPSAHVGQAVTLTLEDEIDISRGDFIVAADENQLTVERSMAVDVVWMHETPLQIGKLYDFKIGTQFVSGQFLRICYQTDVNTLVQHQVDELDLNGIARCEMQLNKPVAFDLYDECKNTGNLIVIDRLNNLTLGAGMIRAALANNTDALPEVTASARAARLAQKAVKIHVSGDNAQTYAQKLEQVLFARGLLPALATDAAVIQALLAAGLITIVFENNTNTLSININNQIFESGDWDGIAAALV